MTGIPLHRLRYDSDSPAHTRRIAGHVGELAPPGLVLALEGDLGSGKTCFVQGLAHGLGVPSRVYVTSPSYTLVNTYEGRLPLHHVDLYRLGADELADIGLFDLMQPPAVVAIEWAERMQTSRPDDLLVVHLEMTAETRRRITLEGYGLAPANLVQALKQNVGE